MKTITEYNQEIQQNPNDAKLFNARGQAYAKEADETGNSDCDNKAIADFTMAIQLDPNYMGPYYNRGMTYYNTGNFNGAIADLTKAIQLEPENAELYYIRGFISLTGKRDFYQAIGNFGLAININSNYKLAYYKRGFAYKGINHYELALDDFNQVIHLDPNNANIYKDRGDIYSNIGKNKEAIEDYSRAIQINPNYAEAYLARGMANDDDLKQSIEDCETALRLNLDKRLIESAMGFLEARKNKLLAKNQLEQN